MTQANVGLLTALEAAGAPAASVAPASALAELPTRAELKAGLADLAARLEAGLAEAAKRETRQTQRLFAATGLVLTAIGIAVGILLAMLS